MMRLQHSVYAALTAFSIQACAAGQQNFDARTAYDASGADAVSVADADTFVISSRLTEINLPAKTRGDGLPTQSFRFNVATDDLVIAFNSNAETVMFQFIDNAAAVCPRFNEVYFMQSEDPRTGLTTITLGDATHPGLILPQALAFKEAGCMETTMKRGRMPIAKSAASAEELKILALRDNPANNENCFVVLTHTRLSPSDDSPIGSPTIEITPSQFTRQQAGEYADNASDTVHSNNITGGRDPFYIQGSTHVSNEAKVVCADRPVDKVHIIRGDLKPWLQPR